MTKRFSITADASAITFGDYLDLSQADGEHCTICGRKIGKSSKMVHLSIAGEVIPMGNWENPESQGCWPIGSECAKKFVKGVLA